MVIIVGAVSRNFRFLVDFCYAAGSEMSDWYDAVSHFDLVVDGKRGVMIIIASLLLSLLACLCCCCCRRRGGAGKDKSVEDPLLDQDFERMDDEPSGDGKQPGWTSLA